MQTINEIDIGCPGCGSSNHLGRRNEPLNLPMPKLFQPSIVRFKCDLCESDVLAKLGKPKGHEASPKGSVRIQAKIMKPSATLVRILQEEREEREKENGVQPRDLARDVPSGAGNDQAVGGVRSPDQMPFAP